MKNRSSRWPDSYGTSSHGKEPRERRHRSWGNNNGRDGLEVERCFDAVLVGGDGRADSNALKWMAENATRGVGEERAEDIHVEPGHLAQPGCFPLGVSSPIAQSPVASTYLPTFSLPIWQ